MASDEIKARIAALLRKARDAGASEAEAMAAAARAAQLMRDYGLSELEIEIEEATARLKTKGKSPRDLLWGTVARCTNTAAIMDLEWSPVITFVGRAPGPQIAEYLVAVLNRAVDREVDRYRTTAEFQRRRSVATRRQACHDFTVGLVARLRVRLLEMFSASMDADARAQAKAVLDARFPHTRNFTATTRKVRFGNAAYSGFAAAGRITLSHGVAGGAPRAQIGRG